MFNMNFSLLAGFFYRLTATMGISKEFHTLKYLFICVGIYLLFLLPVILSFGYAFFMAKEHIESELQQVFLC
jgi:site-specific recombinase